MITVLIIVTVIALYGVLIIWTKANLNEFETSYQIKFIGIGCIITFLITLVLVSANAIHLPNTTASNAMNWTNICIFAPINGLFILPYMARVLNMGKIAQINQEQMNRKICITILIFFVILLIESGYIKNIQAMIK